MNTYCLLYQGIVIIIIIIIVIVIIIVTENIQNTKFILQILISQYYIKKGLQSIILISLLGFHNIIRYNETINMSSYSFNGGIIGFNLDKWRRDNITREVIYWMKENFKNPLWFQGTQPVLYIIGFNNWKCADKRWNVDGLGWTNVPVNAVKSAYILHWNGPCNVAIIHAHLCMLY